MRILVTGGAGFIGSTFVRSLVAGRYPAFAGAQAVVLDLLTYAGTLTNLAAGEYQIICTVPGHREGGMVSRLTVA